MRAAARSSGRRAEATSSRSLIGVVAKIDQHSDRLLLVRAACVAEGTWHSDR